MKRLSAVIFAALMLLTFVGCVDGIPNDGVQAESATEQRSDGDIEEISAVYFHINGKAIEVTLAKNSSVTAFIEILRQGDINYIADDYGGFEKVGGIGLSLPTDDTPMRAEPGDVILYRGNQLVLFYGSNYYSYTRIGKIKGYSQGEIAALLAAGAGSVEITVSLNRNI